jgi:hypothetical protein
MRRIQHNYNLRFFDTCPRYRRRGFYPRGPNHLRFEALLAPSDFDKNCVKII